MENLKGELAKVKVAWEAHLGQTDEQHKEVMALVEPVAAALKSISERLDTIEKVISKKE